MRFYRTPVIGVNSRDRSELPLLDGGAADGAGGGSFEPVFYALAFGGGGLFGESVFRGEEIVLAAVEGVSALESDGEGAFCDLVLADTAHDIFLFIGLYIFVNSLLG